MLNPMHSEKLFEPIQIGGMTLKNRVVMAPMGNNYGAGDGYVSDLTIDHYVQRAKNDVGLIITEAMYVHPSGAHRKKAMGLTQEDFIPGLQKLTIAVHEAGGKIAAQLSHAGRVVPYAHRPGGLGSLGPSSLPHRLTGEHCKEMTLEEIHEMADAFGIAAERARRSGFDAVEVHGTHGYLVMAFISRLWNRRADEYGGIIDNRIRFALEIVDAIRGKAGEDYPVIFRMAGDEMLSGGQTLEESAYLAKKLERAGVSALHVSGGNNETPQDMKNSIATMYTSPGYFVDYAAAIRAEVSIPVIAVGRLGDPELAEQVLEEGKADMICLGRSLLADPSWARKVRSGKKDEIVPCVACNMGCIERLSKQLSISCVQNPLLGRDLRREEIRRSSRNIMVIGAGLAGLEFALRAAEQGHKVEIFEQNSAPGGQVYLASLSPGKDIFKKLIDSRLLRLDALAVPIHYDSPVGLDTDFSGWDHIVVATGGQPFIPDLEWVEAPIVRDAFQVLKEGTRAPYRSAKAIVVGGGSIGLETAHMLGDNGFSVEVLELGEESGTNLVPTVRAALKQRLKESGVTVTLKSTVTAIEDDRVTISSEECDRVVEGVSLVTIAIGTHPDNDLAQKLTDRKLPVSLIGNSAGAPNALETVLQACELALSF
ncbi:NADH oxidase [Synergistales bacterium]|nr:NADH oxidase [Synergistales bacterium]